MRGLRHGQGRHAVSEEESCTFHRSTLLDEPLFPLNLSLFVNVTLTGIQGFFLDIIVIEEAKAFLRNLLAPDQMSD